MNQKKNKIILVYNSTFLLFMTTNKRPIKFVFFDWGGTLAYSGTRDQFIYHPYINRRLDVLKPDAIYTIKSLHDREIGTGIITNTNHSIKDMTQSLMDTGLSQLFECIYYSNSKGMCSKPCRKIFNDAIKCAGVPPGNILYVGNNYFTDVLGANRSGMQSAFLINNDTNRFNEFFAHNGQQDYTIYELSDLVPLFSNNLS